MINPHASVYEASCSKKVSLSGKCKYQYIIYTPCQFFFLILIFCIQNVAQVKHLHHVRHDTMKLVCYTYNLKCQCFLCRTKMIRIHRKKYSSIIIRTSIDRIVFKF